jgi:hypothetical protein
MVVFEASADSLTIRATGPEAAIEYRLSGAFEPVQFAVQPAVLAKCEGRKDMPVQFELLGPKKLRLSWHDGVVPRTHEIDTAKLPNQIFPALPESMQPAKTGLLSGVRFRLTRRSFRNQALSEFLPNINSSMWPEMMLRLTHENRTPRAL